MNNIYEEVLEIIADNQSVAIQTGFTGENGKISDLVRKLVPVETMTDAKGRTYTGVTFEQSENEQGEPVFGVTEPVMPEERLVILGGGHVALQVCEFAAKSGFSVTVCDDRPAFANHVRFPMAEHVLCDTFANCIRKLKITHYDYVVIVTRGHQHDGDCLRVLLQGAEPAYTGMIGSRRRVRGLFEQLEAEGFSRERMNNICTPIGLNIGAKTPEELGISITAELIAYKRMPEHAKERPCNSSDLQLDMIRYLAKDRSPKAVVTVIETKGSTPRGAGAKMTVGLRGEITGSIGGGCSEGAVIRDAIDIIGSGTYQIILIDMTGNVAEEEGMVCGGTMKLLIEDGTFC